MCIRDRCSIEDHFGIWPGDNCNWYIDNKIITEYRNIRIPDGITRIGKYAFQDWKWLTSITIPDSVTNIGGMAFEGCTGLTSVTLGTGVTSIENSAFSDCIGLTSITIPDSVMSIGPHAFSGCDGLTSVTIPDSVTNIGYMAFEGCTGLTSVTLGTGVTSIGDCAFQECIGLISITIPDSVVSMGMNVFYYDSKLIVYCEIASIPSGWDGRWNVNGLPVVWDCNNNNKDTAGYEYAMIDGLRYALKDGDAIVKMQPTSIRGHIKIPERVSYNGKNYSVKSIEDLAFSDCTNLTSVTIPDSVTSIGRLAFSDCGRLTHVGYESTKEQWNRISKDNEWKLYSSITKVICLDGTITL